MFQNKNMFSKAIGRFAMRLATALRGYLLLAICIISAAANLAAQGQRANASSSLLHQFNDSVESLVRRVAASVVEVEAAGAGLAPNEEGEPKMAKWRSIGSGVIVDSDGFIITNGYVIKGAQVIHVTLTPWDSEDPLHHVSNARPQTVDASMVGTAAELDIAVLKIESHGLPKLSISDSRRVRQGQVVFAFGSPEGLRNSVTMGVISAVAREPGPDSAVAYIQTDAPMNSANSGGPLVDIDGNIVGFNTLILTQSGSSEGIGFAIPSHIVALAYQQLRTFGHIRQGDIGATVQDTTPELAAALHLEGDTGVVVSDVVPGSPADLAGLKVRDQIIRVDDNSTQSIPDFNFSLLKHAPGDHVKVMALQDRRKLLIDIRLAGKQNDIETDKSVWGSAIRQMFESADPVKSVINELGIVGVAIEDHIADMLPGLREPSGVIIVAVRSDGSGPQSPLEPGDVIHAANGSGVSSVENLRAESQSATEAPLLQVERDGKYKFIAFPVD